MSASMPPRFATWLLERFDVHNSIVGDLIERYQANGSSLWFWRQAIAAICVTTTRQISSHKLRALIALLVGWSIIGIVGAAPFGKLIWNFTVAWNLDGARSWWFASRVGPLRMLLVPLLTGLISGHIVGRMSTPARGPVVPAFFSTVLVTSLVQYAMLAVTVLLGASNGQDTFTWPRLLMSDFGPVRIRGPLSLLLVVQAIVFLMVPVGACRSLLRGDHWTLIC